VEKTTIVDYLRFSIIDRCNLNCIYCGRTKKSKFRSSDKVLSYEEIVRVVKLFSQAGIRKLRLTGGEPTIRKDFIWLIRMLRDLDCLDEISMTTNGINLRNTAKLLKESGLDRINVSLNSLVKEKYKYITGSDSFEDVWMGIESAIESGLSPVKINVVLLKGINDDEIQEFVKLTYKYPLIVRFIEFFSTNEGTDGLSGCLVETEEIKEKITESFGRLENVYAITGNGPAEYFKPEGSLGAVGFISNSTGYFCYNCSRIRIDCTGRIFPCLFSDSNFDILKLIRNHTDESEIIVCLKDIIRTKSEYTKYADTRKFEMLTIGG